MKAANVTLKPPMGRTTAFGCHELEHGAVPSEQRLFSGRISCAPPTDHLWNNYTFGGDSLTIDPGAFLGKSATTRREHYGANVGRI